MGKFLDTNDRDLSNSRCSLTCSRTAGLQDKSSAEKSNNISEGNVSEQN